MKSRFVIFAALAVFTLASCMKKEGTSTDSSTNAKADSMKAAYKAISAAWDAGNVTEFDKYISPNSVDHDPMPGQKPGLEGMKEMAKMMKASYPDMKSTIDYIGVDGDILTARFHMAGTNSGPMMGMPPTGKKVNVEGVDMVKWENGKFTEHWGVFDAMGMMQQLGMAPMPGAPPAGDMGKPMDKKKM